MEIIRLEKFPVYLPENLNLDKIIYENPPDKHFVFLDAEGKKKENVHFKKDKLIYILHLISYLPTIKKNYNHEDNGGFVLIKKQRLQDIGIHDYRQHIDYLIKCGVILEDHHYEVGEKSGGLKFTNKYIFSEVHRVYITDKILINNIIGNFQKSINEFPEEFSYLSKWWDTGLLNIDYDKATKFIKERRTKDVRRFRLKYNMNQKEYYKRLRNPFIPNALKKRDAIYPDKRHNASIMTIDRFKNKEYVLKIDKTAGRLHTPLTQLDTELRQFVSYNGEALVSIDLINSQPFLATALLDREIFLNNPVLFETISYYNPHHNRTQPNVLADFIGRVENENDVREYKRIVARGEYYEEFGKELCNKNLLERRKGINLRDKAKEATFASFYASNFDSNNIPAAKYFREIFPNVYKVFYEIKYFESDSEKDDKVHKALSVSLQAFEAEIILKKVCKCISEITPNIPIFTIHDSVVTTKGNEGIVKQVIEDEIFKIMGVKPQLKTEQWNEPTN